MIKLKNSIYAIAITYILLILTLAIIADSTDIRQYPKKVDIVEEAIKYDIDEKRLDIINKYFNDELSHHDMIDSLGTLYLKDYLHRYYGMELDSIKIYSDDL